jgi:hypothetical protein
MKHWYTILGSGRRSVEAPDATQAINEMLGHSSWHHSGPNEVTVPGAPGHTRIYGFGPCSKEFYERIKERG